MCPCGGVNHSHAVIHIGRGTRLSASRPASSLREARAGDAEGSSLATAVYTVPPGAAAAPGATLLGLHCGPDVFRCFFLSPGGGEAGAQQIDKTRSRRCLQHSHFSGRTPAAPVTTSQRQREPDRGSPPRRPACRPPLSEKRPPHELAAKKASPRGPHRPPAAWTVSSGYSTGFPWPAGAGQVSSQDPHARLPCLKWRERISPGRLLESREAVTEPHVLPRGMPKENSREAAAHQPAACSGEEKTLFCQASCLTCFFFFFSLSLSFSFFFCLRKEKTKQQQKENTSRCCNRGRAKHSASLCWAGS